MGHKEDDWELAVDQWRAKRQQKRSVNADNQFVSASLDLSDRTDSPNDFLSASQPSRKKPQIKTFQQMVAEREAREKSNGLMHLKEDSKLIKEIDYFPVLKDSQPNNTPLVSILASNLNSSQPEQEYNHTIGTSLVKNNNNSRTSPPNQTPETESMDLYRPFSNFSKPTHSDERSRGNAEFLHSMPSYEMPETQQIRKTGRSGQKPPPPKVAPKPKKCKSPESRPEVKEKLNASSSLGASENDSQQKIPVTFFYFMPSAVEDETMHDYSSQQKQDGTNSPYMNSEMVKNSQSGEQETGGTLLLTVSQNNQDTSDESQNGFGFGMSGANGSPVKITGVVADVSSANLCNLREGDEILSINGQKVNDLSHDQVVAIMSEAVQSGNICLRINRSGLEVTCQTMDERGVNHNYNALPLQQSQLSTIELEKVSRVNGSDANDYIEGPVPAERSLFAKPAPTVDASWTSSNFDAEDAIIVEDVYMPDLQSIPDTSFPSHRAPVGNSVGQVSSSKDFFEKMQTQEEEDVKEKTEQLKKSRKDQEILERQLEAQRGRKFNSNEPINYLYSFNIPDIEDTTTSSRDNVVPSSSNRSRESNDKLSYGINANSSRADLILGNSVADVEKFLDDDLTSEMEEFEAEFASQQEQMMKLMQERDNADPDNYDVQFSDDPEITHKTFSRDQSFSIGKSSSNRRDPAEDIIAPHRAPSRGSGVVAPASFTPQNQSLNTSIDSQESLPTSGAKTGSQFITNDQLKKGEDERDRGSRCSPSTDVNERQQRHVDDWVPSLSGPVHSQRPTIMFDPTGGGTSQRKSLNRALTPRNERNDDEDLDEMFTTAKKALDRKFREQKRNLYNKEADRIEQDQIELNLEEEKLKKQGKSNHNWEQLNALKLSFAEDQKIKDQMFEDSVEDLKQRYHEDLEKLCKNHNRKNLESYVESDMRLNRTPKPELVNMDDQSPSDQNVGNLSPRKYDLVKRWAEDTSQNMENNAIDISKDGLDMPYLIEPKAATHNIPVLHATETPNGLDETDIGGGKTRVPLISVGRESNSDGQKSRNGSSSELLAPTNIIKRRPISGITKNDQGKLQTYYTPISPRSVTKNHDNNFSKDVQNFNSWLDSLRSPTNPSMPKISRPKAENFVERFDLPSGEVEDSNQNEPLPQNVIKAIFARLDPNASNANNRSSNREPVIRPSKRPSREKEKPISNQPQTPSNLRKWKSAPMDVNEVITPVEGTPLHQYPSIEVSSQENLWQASPEGNFNPRFPSGKSNTQGPGRNNGFRNSAYKPLPPVPGPVEDENYMNLIDPRLLQPTNDFGVGFQHRLDFNPDMPASIPPRSSKPESNNRLKDRFHSSGPPQHFQEMSVDEPGSKPMKWNPMQNGYSRDDPKTSVPWNSRSMDHLNNVVDPTSLNRRFQFRDAHDPHGFKTIQRNKQYYPESPNNMSMHNSNFSNSQHTSCSQTPMSTLKRNRIPGLSEVHLQEEMKQQNKSTSRRISSREPCTKCGLALGKGSAVVVESLNLLFHHECFHCSICLKPLKCEDVGTNIKVRGCNVHCEDCSFNEKESVDLLRERRID